MNKIKDLIIIGSGPAGLSAALYASRANIDTTIIYSGAPGGKLLNTHLVDNYLGLPKEAGFNLAMKFIDHGIDEKIESINEKVIDIEDIEKDIKVLITESGKKIKTKSLIITSGSSPREPQIPGYKKYFGKGVSTCMVCDGAFYRGKEIIVIGGGLSAVEESIYSLGIIKKITIINKFPSLKIDNDLLEKVNNSPSIEVFNNSNVKEIIGDDNTVKSVVFINEKNEEITKNVSGVFVYTGWIPSNNFISKTNLLDEDGFVNVNKETMETSIKGVFAAGDIVKNKHSQIIIAAADGTKAALSVKEFLNK